MDEHCFTQGCERRAITVRPVSVREPNDAERSFCAVCGLAYTIGVGHGSIVTLNGAMARTTKQLVADKWLLEAVLDALISRDALSEQAARALRMARRLPCPVDLDSDIAFGDEGKAAIDPAARERVKGFADEIVALLVHDPAKEPTP